MEDRDLLGTEDLIAEQEVIDRIEAMATEEKPFEPVTLDDLRVVRDESGKVIPLEVYTPMEGNGIRMLPLTVRDRLKYKLRVEDNKRVSDYPISFKYKLIVNHIVDPDLSDMTQDEMVEQFGYTTIDDLAAAVLMYSRDLFRQPLLKVQPKGTEKKVEEKET